ncbi:MAG: hypothetical protein A2169_05115 [Deltaproteobacteria bacterium RBG_13_47_9]|nr:MAG: hypothetical protein A2169_05115 [Deltaproteobacteria bacterium RBG_13_47_9]
MRDLTLKPEYSSSHALIIGINSYVSAPPLLYAVNDAKAVADTLENRFAFSSTKITLLLDEDATRGKILSEYLRFEREGCDRDSRLLVFFAGHGFTKSSPSREVGFLVPYDGKVDDLSTLIRWEELTLNAELIPCKHILFIMDACYGGLAFSRTISAAGAVRFLKDMLLRPVRQALTAGKADEPVSDGGNLRAGHSIFTGYLLDALEGAAQTPEGLLTATGVMSHVYKQVSGDIHSRQTPHYGFLSGDGEFIFLAPHLGAIPPSETKEQDELISIPSLEIPIEEGVPSDPVGVVKDYLSDSKYKIRLQDLVLHNVRKLIVETSRERFPVEGVDFSLERLTERIQAYEAATKDLRRLLAYIAYWGTDDHRPILGKSLARVTDHIEPESGLVIWTSLRWYPTILFCYTSGIAAISNGSYQNLQTIFSTKVTGRGTDQKLAAAISNAISDMRRENIFERLPGHEKYYAARSEYLFKLLQRELDDDLFLGKEYEAVFDRFEVLLALVSATSRKASGPRVWGPVGRFGWKYSRDQNPLKDVLREAEQLKEKWEPFKAGIFGTDFEFFWQAAIEYSAEISRLGWF